MDNLAMSLRTMCEHNRDGSAMTQAQRGRGLAMVADELKALGFKLPDAKSLKGKHVNALLGLWRGKGIASATLKNRVGWLRFWAEKTGKVGMIPRDNAALGIAEKSTWKGKRAAITPADKARALPERMQLAIRLQMAFGLRLEESLKIRVSEADNGTMLSLQASWCKGGRARSIPLTHPRQRDLLDEIQRVCGTGSLIPEHMSYINFRQSMESATLKAGITNMHKHRHWYANWRYRVLAGEPSPADGGRTHNGLSASERKRLDDARLQVSRELGHNRIDVTDAYLGPRWEKGAKQ
ncbi:phage integrase N-terminal domain-containing protein [Nitrobacter sp. JJSN]|uniref:phage integrase N-terminal domain-containing protein n=1 Tax=Nitrobacter sp. JJSN TaxID=3453033 RepID=UPI003F775BCE